MTDPAFRRLYPPAAAEPGPAHWLLINGEELLAPPDAASVLLPGTTAGPDGLAVDAPLLFGMLDSQPVFAAAWHAESVPNGLQSLGLRAVIASMPPHVGGIASYAVQLLRFRRTVRFCPACAQPLAPVDGSWGVGCACGQTFYPPVSPAIIVLIHDGDRALLTTKPGWGKRYSLVAGFVEPGETFEECVVREVREEVGVEVGAVRYVASQQWPFPHQIMVGFMAQYRGGEIAIDATELAHADWFSRAELPELPLPFTISRQIIERWRTSQD